jgi:hypothetical protein
MDDILTPAELDEIQARVNKATEGPWEYSCGIISQNVAPFDSIVDLEDNYHPLGNYQTLILDESNAAFIAHARTDIPRLLATVRSQAGEIERMWKAEPMQPLTLNQLKSMNDERVIIRCPELEMAALVSFHPEGSEGYDESDGDEVWLTNNLGGRSIYEDVIASGFTVFGRPLPPAPSAEDKLEESIVPEGYMKDGHMGWDTTPPKPGAALPFGIKPAPSADAVGKGVEG